MKFAIKPSLNFKSIKASSSICWRMSNVNINLLACFYYIISVWNDTHFHWMNVISQKVQLKSYCNFIFFHCSGFQGNERLRESHKNAKLSPLTFLCVSLHSTKIPPPPFNPLPLAWCYAYALCYTPGFQF